MCVFVLICVMGEWEYWFVSVDICVCECVLAISREDQRLFVLVIVHDLIIMRSFQEAKYGYYNINIFLNTNNLQLNTNFK